MLGTRPVPRGINAAAPAAAMPAAETSREVGRLSGGGNPWAWEEWSAAFLFFPSWEGLQSSSFLPTWPLNPKLPLS